MSTLCDNIDCQENKSFNPELSCTYVPTDVEEQTFYGSGSFKGKYCYDSMRIGLGYADINIEHQPIALVTHNSLLNSRFDAVLGMAFKGMQEFGQSFVDSIYQQRLLL
jgi:hypothetical protein